MAIDRNERLHSMQRMESEMKRLRSKYGTACSDECLRLMKQVYRLLRIMIVECETGIIDRKKREGVITPMKARSMKAKLRKRMD